MTRNTKIVKKIEALFLVLLLSIESFAAIVSDNDGSAFVTKAEFEGMKSNFAEQVDDYNTSIDEKIDGAIASYLQGITLDKVQSESIIMSDWDDVTCYNGSFAPTYSLPTVNIGFTYIHCWPQPFQLGGRNGYWNYVASYLYSNPGTDYIYRPLVTGNAETNQTTNMVWNGIAYKYMEHWNISKTNMQTNGDWLMWLDGPIDYDFGGTLQNALRFAPDGYYSNAKDIIATWNPTLYWQWKQKTDTTWNRSNITINATNDKNYIAVFNVALKQVNSKETFHDHIIEYDGAKTWRLSNETFTHTFRSVSPWTSTNLIQYSTITGLTAFYGLLNRHGTWTYEDSKQKSIPGGDDPYFDSGGGTIAPNVEDTSDTVLPSVGMLEADQKAEDIYQFADKKNITFKNDTVELDKQTLEKGFPLFYVKNGYEISWEPVFEKYYKNDGSGWVEQNDKIKLYLSYGPFSDLTTTTKPVEFTTKKYGTKATSQIIDLTGDKITFTSEKDSIIYAKWVPNTTSYNTDIWYSTLDLSNCNKYSYIEKT